MRAYKFLDEKYGLTSLQQRRLKQSRVSDLNDPFELLPYDVTNLIYRKTFHQTRIDVNRARGLLCFSGDWKNPVIWAHYSDKHRGLCLGFEIPELAGIPQNDDTDHVTYIEKLLQCPDFDSMSDEEHISFTRAALFTKFKHWEYEKEIRVWGLLQNAEKGLNFVCYGESLKLVEVILGARSALARAQILEVLGPLAEGVKISKARAAYDQFEMVEDEDWF
jgi:Protein of unknown function (DUF2971)